MDSTTQQGWYQSFKIGVKKLKNEITALYYALQSDQVTIIPKLFASIAIAYAVSPLDLIPDFIPVLGLIDDLIILPLLIWIAIKFIPQDVMDRARARALTEPLRLPSNWIAATLFFIIWDIAFAWLGFVLIHHFGNEYVVENRKIIVGCSLGLIVSLEIAWVVYMTMEKKRSRENEDGQIDNDVEEPLLQEE